MANKMQRMRRGVFILKQALVHSNNSEAIRWFCYEPSVSSTALPNHQTLHHLLQCCKHSCSDVPTATRIHARLIKLGYGSSPFLAASLLSAYAHSGSLRLAARLLHHILCSSSSDRVYLNLVIENLMRSGYCNVAKRVFDNMPVRDLVGWNSMIGGYVKNGRFGEAFKFLKRMLSAGVQPDGYTFASLLKGCARLGVLSYAQWVHGVMTETRIGLNSILTSALIHMYSKCGRIHTAKQIFNCAQRNDVSIWNAMISGLAIHGLALDAIAIFSMMELENVSPDSITFVGILTSCSHCGLVDQGRYYFNLMRTRYSIQPELEHYGAMVDLLGRVGLLEEAYAVVQGMPVEPDVVIWRALLSACRIYRNLELSEIAIANISHLESGDYVLLSNMYCSLEQYDSAEELRETMKRKRVRKTSGKSWIEIAGRIKQFKACDQSHPEAKAIYDLLEKLIQRTKLEGFTHSTELVLMDVSEEEKEANLRYHSEKLALAYGILKTSPGTEIRISKNIRVCHDCHNWINIVSKVLNRMIIVRDRVRFHHFKGGSCSCGGYW